MLWGKVNSTVLDASLRQARTAPERLGIPANVGSHGTPLLPPSTPKPRAALRLWLWGMLGPARLHHTGPWWRGSGTGWTACARLECRRETQPRATHVSTRLFVLYRPSRLHCQEGETSFLCLKWPARPWHTTMQIKFLYIKDTSKFIQIYDEKYLGNATHEMLKNYYTRPQNKGRMRPLWVFNFHTKIHLVYQLHKFLKLQFSSQTFKKAGCYSPFCGSGEISCGRGSSRCGRQTPQFWVSDLLRYDSILGYHLP